jgi:hypothetical protein
MSTLVSDLAAWQWFLLVIYALYTLGRAVWIFNSGLRDALLGYGDTIKLYHILWTIVDIPAILLGKFFPVLKAIFNIPVIPLKKENK